MNFRKKLASITALATILTQTAFASDLADENTFYDEYGYNNRASVYYNGENVAFSSVYPLVYQGTTFVPIRTFTEYLGATVNYIQSTHSVEIIKDDITVFFDIGSADIYVNGELKTLSTETFLIGGSTMVPLRLISEAYNYDVSWNQSYKEVSIMDMNSLKSNLDTDYTIFEGILALDNSSNFINALINAETDFNISIDNKNINIKTDSQTLVVDNNLSTDMDIQIDFDDYKDDLISEFNSDASLAPYKDDYFSILDKFNNFNVSFMLDWENLTSYIKSDILVSIYNLSNDSNINPTSWITSSFDTYYYDDILDELYQEDIEVLTLEDIIDLTIETNQSNSFEYYNSYEIVSEFLSRINNNNFVKSGNTYTLSKTESIANLELNYKLIVNTSSDEVTSFGFYVNSPDFETANMSFEMNNANHLEFSLNFIYDIIDLSANMSFDISETTEKIVFPTENLVDVDIFDY